MTLRPLFYSDQDCRDRLKPGKPMFFNVYLDWNGNQYPGNSHISREGADFIAHYSSSGVPPYRIVVKAKPTPSPEESAA